MNIKYDTERFKNLGECLEFLKKYKYENYYNNQGINVLSDFEVYDIIQYLEFYLSEELTK